jgi:hypothetical protein
MFVQHFFHREWFDDRLFITGFHAVNKEHSKPKVGMIFDALADVEKFYKPMHTIMVSLFVLVSTRREMMQYYSSGIIVQGKGTERRA